MLVVKLIFEKQSLPRRGLAYYQLDSYQHGIAAKKYPYKPHYKSFAELSCNLSFSKQSMGLGENSWMGNLLCTFNALPN